MRFLKRFYLGLIFLFLYAPILILMVFSFNDSKSRGNWGGFTLRWYAELFRDREIMSALYYTIVIAILSALIATAIGMVAALGIHNMNRFGKGLVINITYLPMLNPDIVTGISLMILFVFVNMERGFISLLIAHITFNIPYVIFSIMPKLKQMNQHLYEAALDLGATPFYAFRKVILPEIMPGVITGLIFAFTLSIDDFVISYFTTGAGVSNLSIVIHSMARRGINPTINALSTLMFITVLLLLIIVNKRTANNSGKENVI
ncbi:MAG: ABC transporter permease [Clostridiales bacterium]|nr:ABC transporter permease [Clostridiales bacterium]